MRKILGWIPILICMGCSTPYQNMGFSGGVEAQQMTAHTFRIVARGNAYTSPTVIQDYVALKAAETTVQQGGTHFIVVSAADASRSDQIVTGGTAHTTFNGNFATTTYSPPERINIYKPGQDAYIRVVRVREGQQPPPGAVAASEIIQFVGSRVKKAQ